MRRVSDLINVLDGEVLSRINFATDADYKVLKLKSDLVLKMLLFTLIGGQKATLSALQATFENAVFQRSTGIAEGTSTGRNSIHDRLLTIKWQYFEQLYNHCLAVFGPVLQGRATVRGKTLLRFDTTVVRIGAALLGFSNYRKAAKDKAGDKQVKFSIGYDGILPLDARLFTEQRHSSEELTLGPAMLGFEGLQTDSVVVFDSGVQSRDTFGGIDEQGICFVGRLREGARHTMLCQYEHQHGRQQASAEQAGVTIEEDSSVILYASQGRECRRALRLVKARIIKTGKALWLVTNLIDEPAWLIAELYRRRWDIEVFFRLLKSELSFSHLAARNKNGLLVLLYSTLVAAILIQVYRWENEIKGYKAARMRLENELQKDLITQIIIACGGDPHKWTHAP